MAAPLKQGGVSLTACVAYVRELFLRIWDSAVPLLKFVGLDERARFIEQFAFELYSSLVCFAASVSG